MTKKNEHKLAVCWAVYGQVLFEEARPYWFWLIIRLAGLGVAAFISYVFLVYGIVDIGIIADSGSSADARVPALIGGPVCLLVDTVTFWVREIAIPCYD